MSNKLASALTAYNTFKVNKSRAEIIVEIAHICDCSAGYASTLYAKAKKMSSAPARPAANAPSPSTRNEAASIKKPVAAIAEFSKPNLKMLRQEMTEALAMVAARHGIDLSIGNISYSSNKFTAKITAVAGDGSEEAQQTWNDYSFDHKMSSDTLGKTFRSNGTEFKITGYKPRGKKFKISGERVSDGASFKFTVAQVQRSLGANA